MVTQVPCREWATRSPFACRTFRTQMLTAGQLPTSTFRKGLRITTGDLDLARPAGVGSSASWRWIAALRLYTDALSLVSSVNQTMLVGPLSVGGCNGDRCDHHKARMLLVTELIGNET